MYRCTRALSLTQLPKTQRLPNHDVIVIPLFFRGQFDELWAKTLTHELRQVAFVSVVGNLYAASTDLL